MICDELASVATTGKGTIVSVKTDRILNLKKFYQAQVHNISELYVMADANLIVKAVLMSVYFFPYAGFFLPLYFLHLLKPIVLVLLNKQNIFTS